MESEYLAAATSGNGQDDESESDNESFRVHRLAEQFEEMGARAHTAVVDEPLDEAKPTLMAIEGKRDRILLLNLSQRVRIYFKNVRGLEAASEAQLYEEVTTLAHILGYPEDQQVTQTSKYTKRYGCACGCFLLDHMFSVDWSMQLGLGRTRS